jgi:hypothetical protein
MRLLETERGTYPSIAIPEEDMIGVNGMNSFLSSFIPSNDSNMLLIGRFIQGIVTSNLWYPSCIIFIEC